GEQGNKKDTEGAFAKIPFKRHCRGQEALWGEPLFLLQDKSQVRRAEKHWEGPHDLSAAAWACHDGERFLLKVCVTDDHVYFGGGKFYFDNDSIQVYFDNRGELHRKAGSMQGTYGLMVLPGAYDNCARVQSIGEKIHGLEKIGVSVVETEEGYEVFLDIPWECVGGAPAAGERRGFDIIVNDRDRGVRRDLQMVWSGCQEDERIYLREDHHNPDRFGVVVFCGEEP
ncbi:MAG: sugar-binding protein, partial [Clostridia bacterium]